MTCPNCHKPTWELTTIEVGFHTPQVKGWREEEMCDGCIEDFFKTCCYTEIERNQEVYDEFNPDKRISNLFDKFANELSEIGKGIDQTIEQSKRPCN